MEILFGEILVPFGVEFLVAFGVAFLVFLGFWCRVFAGLWCRVLGVLGPLLLVLLVLGREVAAMAMEEYLVKMMELIGISGRPVMMAMGVLLALLSAVANGSFTVFFKTRSVRRAQVSPLIFSFWAS